MSFGKGTKKTYDENDVINSMKKMKVSKLSTKKGKKSSKKAELDNIIPSMFPSTSPIVGSIYTGLPTDTPDNDDNNNAIDTFAPVMTATPKPTLSTTTTRPTPTLSTIQPTTVPTSVMTNDGDVTATIVPTLESMTIPGNWELVNFIPDLSTSFSLSKDTSRIAAGLASGFGVYVQVYSRQSTKNNDINKNNNNNVDNRGRAESLDLELELSATSEDGSGNYFGYGLALSGNSNVIAITGWNSADSYFIRIYVWNNGDEDNDNNNTWDLVDTISRPIELMNSFGSGNFGSRLSFNDNGTLLVVSAPLSDYIDNNVGQIFVYRLEEGTGHVLDYVQISGEIPLDMLGEDISISGNGNKIAVSLPGQCCRSGKVQVYQLEHFSTEEAGSDITSDTSPTFQLTPVGGTLTGNTVSLSYDGTILAVGIPYMNSNNPGNGTVMAYRYDETENDWKQIGQTLVGEAEYDVFGTSVDISSDGTDTYLAVGIPGSDSNPNGEFCGDAGSVQVYALVTGDDDEGNNHNGKKWVQVGNELYGTSGDGGLGTNVNFSKTNNNGVLTVATNNIEGTFVYEYTFV